MFRRLPTYLSLVCYSAIALWGQGLHEFLDDDCDHVDQSSIVASQSAEPVSAVGGYSISAHQGHVHDCDNCPICQFQSMGQHFIAPLPADVGLVKCDVLSDRSTESVYCPTFHSPAQPRAPPLV
jgi:hypothetical protein